MTQTVMSSTQIQTGLFTYTMHILALRCKQNDYGTKFSYLLQVVEYLEFLKIF